MMYIYFSRTKTNRNKQTALFSVFLFIKLTFFCLQNVGKANVEAIFSNKKTGPTEFTVVDSIVQITRIDLHSDDVTGVPGYTEKLRVDVTMSDGTKYPNVIHSCF